MLVAAAIKAALLFVVFPGLMRAMPGTYMAGLFADNYDEIAWNLASGLGYRVHPDTSLTILRTPGYVLPLAALFWAFGKSLIAVQAMNFIFTTSAAVLVLNLTKRHTGSLTYACVAASIVLFHPGAVVADSRGGLESMLMLCIALTLWLADRCARGASTLDAVWLGLCFGVGLLVKSSIALTVPAVVLWIWFAAPPVVDRKRLALRLFAACTIAGACLVPWVIRNYQISGRFIPTMTVGGLAMYQGLHVVRSLGSDTPHAEVLSQAARQQQAIAEEMGLRASGDFFQQFGRTEDEIAFYGELRNRAWKEYLDHRGLIAKAVVYNAWAFWFQGRSPKATWLNTLISLPLLALFAMGAWSSRRDDRIASLSIIVLLAYIAPHLIILSMARYYIPVLPCIALVAAGPLARTAGMPVAALRRAFSRASDPG